MRILLGVTGSVATIVVPKLILGLRSDGHEVQVVPTEKSLHFCGRNELMFCADGTSVPVWTDKDEWMPFRLHETPVVHISLRDWAQVLLVAPLTANTLGKMAYGLADNLLSSVIRAWDVKSEEKRIVIAPAMNTDMWLHPATAEHLEKLKVWCGSRLIVVPPIEKKLACGAVGKGAMAEVATIVQAIRTAGESLCAR